jgi:AraC-like DNA-binding protein
MNRPRFSSIPTATGGIARAAYARGVQVGLDIEPLLEKSGLSVRQAENSHFRIAVKNQIKFLNLVAEAVPDEFLGVHLAECVDLRELGLLYYVLASSSTLADALKRFSRYSAIHNEGVQITYRESNNKISMLFKHMGVARQNDRHQIEFFVVTLLRLCRQLTGRHLSPIDIKLMHRRRQLPAKLKLLFGCNVAFGSDLDDVTYAQPLKNTAVVNGDPYLNTLLVKYCEEALSDRRVKSHTWQLHVENAITPLLPHGQAAMAEIAQRLGLSRRTLARRLASEGHTFGEVLDRLRFNLAKRYLQEHDLPISEVAWLLGYQETSAFNHAFKRWTGKTPLQVRAAGVRAPSSRLPVLHPSRQRLPSERPPRQRRG